MILYNVTFGVDKEIETEWVAWMRSMYIPAILETGAFVSHKFYKVLTHDEENSASYCVQYFTPSIVDFNRFLENHAQRFIDEQRSRYKDRHVAFNTLLEEVE